MTQPGGRCLNLGKSLGRWLSERKKIRDQYNAAATEPPSLTPPKSRKALELSKIIDENMEKMRE
jgi:hypothetical protein